MEKAISDLIENNTQSDQNEYYSKVVQVCYIQLVDLECKLGEFNYPNFIEIFDDLKHMKELFIIYNNVVGKSNMHVKISMHKTMIQKIYSYYFSPWNPPTY